MKQTKPTIITVLRIAAWILLIASILWAIYTYDTIDSAKVAEQNAKEFAESFGVTVSEGVTVGSLFNLMPPVCGVAISLALFGIAKTAEAVWENKRYLSSINSRLQRADESIANLEKQNEEFAYNSLDTDMLFSEQVEHIDVASIQPPKGNRCLLCATPIPDGQMVCSKCNSLRLKQNGTNNL